MNNRYLFTSESVSEGHPDKMADQISDAILDAYLEADPDSKVACECLLTDNRAILAGEITSATNLAAQIPEIVRDVIKGVGYNADSGYDPEKIRIENHLHEQSPEILAGVDRGGAGDQGLMFGYACNETPELMPFAIQLAHRFMERQASLRKSEEIPWLLPDAKSQVTVIYEDGKVVGIDNIVISTQHAPYFHSADTFWSSGTQPHGHYSGLRSVSQGLIRKTVIEEILKPLINEDLVSDNTLFHINPSGSFLNGGPATDTGLTGRKIIVDTYGGSCPHGGGAFSGKDPSKVDRSAAYMARYLAKNIVASGAADKCLVQLAYAIGMPEPVSLMIEFFGTGKTSASEVTRFIEKNIDLTPTGIIDRLQLKRPIYQDTAAYGHFGREKPEFRWEAVDFAGQFQRS